MSAKEQHILDAALELFSKRGYDGTTVPMIAEQAKVGAGTIYRYFHSKEMIANVLYSNCIQQFYEEVKKDYPTNSSIREQFKHIFLSMAAYGKKSPAGFYFIEKHTYHHCIEEDGQLAFQQFLDFFRSFLQNGVKTEILRPLPLEALISIVYGAFSGLYKFIIVGEIEETDLLIYEVEECCWEAISTKHGMNTHFNGEGF